MQLVSLLLAQNDFRNRRSATHGGGGTKKNTLIIKKKKEIQALVFAAALK